MDKTSAMFHEIFSDLHQAGLIWHFADSRLEWIGDAASIMILEPALVPADATGFKSLVHPQDLPSFLSALQTHATTAAEQGMAKLNEPFRLRGRDGTFRPLRLEGRVTIDDTGAPVLSAILHIDHDSTPALNGETILAGRSLIAQELESIVLSRSAGTRGRGYFMALGLDRVGLLNEAYGAACVDTVLIEIERRLRNLFEKQAAVCRISGDVYGLIMPDLPHQQADSTAAALLQTFTNTPVLTLYGPVMIGLSIGGVPLSSADEKGSDIIARAEAAMLTAKERGRGCFVVSTPHDQKREYARSLLASGQTVYKALEEGRMRMAFQPVMDMKTREISFFESLIRMIDEDGRLVAAEEFVPALENLGMTRLLDIYALHSAIRELEQFPDIRLSVNVSNHSLIDAGWLRSAVSLLAGKKQVAARLIVEITESSVMQDLAHAMRVVQTLKDLGCRIALDDFGAGSTSFRQLKMLNVDVVKIDKSYIRDIHDPVNMLFVRALLDLASGLDLQTVAEGAETLAEAEMLQASGIAHVQGYAFGFPSIERVWLPKNHASRTQKSA